jgi:hypothetical protein
MLTAKYDVATASEADTKELLAWLGISEFFASSLTHPIVVFFPRLSRLDSSRDFSLFFPLQAGEEFREFVWEKLQMSLTIINKTPWTLHQWWLDGTRGKKLEDIAPDGRYNMNTFLSHAFVYRPSFVQGNILNNEVRWGIVCHLYICMY